MTGPLNIIALGMMMKKLRKNLLYFQISPPPPEFGRKRDSILSQSLSEFELDSSVFNNMTGFSKSQT